MRARAAAPLLFVVLAFTGCGGSSGDGGSGAQTLHELERAGGAEVALIPGTRDLVPGPVRYSFLVLDDHGKPIERPSARVWIARDRDAVPFKVTSARLESIGATGLDLARQGVGGMSGQDGTGADVNGIYVLNTRIDRPGRFWLLARPVGAEIQGIGNLVVKDKADTPAVGSPAPRSDTPTLGDAPIRLLTTRTPPDRALLHYSVADSIRSHVPFVVTFATPAFCESRLCGPVVDVVDRVRRDLEGSGVRFIHVEIYKDNKPSAGVNRWVRQWNLPSEPWTFLVGRDGRIVGKFEAAVSVRELRAAVRRLLIRR